MSSRVITTAQLRERKWDQDSLDPTLDQHGDYWMLIQAESNPSTPIFTASCGTKFLGIAYVCPLSYKTNVLEPPLLLHRHYLIWNEDIQSLQAEDQRWVFEEEEANIVLVESPYIMTDCGITFMVRDSKWTTEYLSER